MMTRETKAGLVVSCSFLSLVGTVLYNKLSDKNPQKAGQESKAVAESPLVPPDPNPSSPSATAADSKVQPVSGLPALQPPPSGIQTVSNTDPNPPPPMPNGGTGDNKGASGASPTPPDLKNGAAGDPKGDPPPPDMNAFGSAGQSPAPPAPAAADNKLPPLPGFTPPAANAQAAPVQAADNKPPLPPLPPPGGNSQGPAVNGSDPRIGVPPAPNTQDVKAPSTSGTTVSAPVGGAPAFEIPGAGKPTSDPKPDAPVLQNNQPPAPDPKFAASPGQDPKLAAAPQLNGGAGGFVMPDPPPPAVGSPALEKKPQDVALPGFAPPNPNGGVSPSGPAANAATNFPAPNGPGSGLPAMQTPPPPVAGPAAAPPPDPVAAFGKPDLAAQAGRPAGNQPAQGQSSFPENSRPMPPLGAPTSAVAPPIPAGTYTLNPLPQTQSSAPQVDSYDEEMYRARPGDTFQTIARGYYQSDNYGQALAQFNRSHPLATPGMRQDPPVLQPGDSLYIPPKRILEKYYGSAINVPGGGLGSTPIPAGAAPRSVATGPERQYKVRGNGEMIREISQRTLGSAERWTEIMRLNPQCDPLYPIPAGSQLRMPPDAIVD